MAFLDFLSKHGVNPIKKSGIGNVITPTFIPLDFINGLTSGSDVSKQKALLYFLTVPQLFQIISMKASMFSNGMFQVVSKETEKPVALTNPIAKLIQRPNWYQGPKEFFTLTKTFREIYENEYVHFTKPIGFNTPKQISSIDPLKLSLPSDLVRPTKPLFLMTSTPEFNYKYTEGATSYNIPSADVLQVNNPAVKGGLVGSGRMTSLKQNMDNIIGAYASRGSLIFSRGALGILSNASKDGIGAAGPMLEPDKKQLQDDYQKYGLNKGQWQLLITNLSLNYQRIAMNPKELMLFEEVEDDFNTLIGAFGLRRELFPNVKGATFENQKEAEKAAYTNTIIPDANEWVSAMNTYLGLDKTSYHIVVDYMHLPAFAEDLKNKGIALKNYIGALSLAFQDGALSKEDYTAQLNEIL